MSKARPATPATPAKPVKSVKSATPTATQNERILSFLENGNTLTAKQALSMFGVNYIGKRVSELRAEGYPIYTNTSSTGSTVYRLGRPSRAMVAAAYAAVGSELFS